MVYGMRTTSIAVISFIIPLSQYAHSDYTYSTVVQPAKIKLFLLPKRFVIYRQVFLTFLASKSLKLSFTSEIVT